MHNQHLYSKIIDLFNYRLFPQLLDHSNFNNQQKEDLNQKLINLQSEIYYLDAHLEANWETDQSAMQSYWDKIIRAITKFNIKKEKAEQLVSHIKKYEKHELELRQDFLPTRLSMEYFYFYKSCDVKLLRKLIYHQVSSLRSLATHADWRYFDLITEINDDVEDVIEDLETINGNRFLISILQYGKNNTKEIFMNFIDDIYSRSKQRFLQPQNYLQEQIHSKTTEAIDQTKSLILSQLDNHDLIKLSEFKLTKYSTILSTTPILTSD